MNMDVYFMVSLGSQSAENSWRFEHGACLYGLAHSGEEHIQKGILFQKFGEQSIGSIVDDLVPEPFILALDYGSK